MFFGKQTCLINKYSKPGPTSMSPWGKLEKRKHRISGGDKSCNFDIPNARFEHQENIEKLKVFGYIKWASSPTKNISFEKYINFTKKKIAIRSICLWLHMGELGRPNPL